VNPLNSLSGRLSGRPRSPRAAALGTVVRLVLAGGLVASGVAVAAPSQAAANPYERGPAPTAAALERNGPYAVDTYAVANPQGFPSGQIYAPRSSETFGAIALAPGFFSSWSQLSWMGPRLASHGIVVVGINTQTPWDGPPERAAQLWAGLVNLVHDTRVNARVDWTRLSVGGWSMGGGGALRAAQTYPQLKTVVALAGWDINKNFAGVTAPTLFLAGETDTVAPASGHSTPFYNSITAPEKSLATLQNASHFFPTSDNPNQSRLMVAWLKRFLDNDTRYTQFLCPGPSSGDTGQVQQYQATCPM
jgi:dienelactone hydrolase